MDVEGNEIADKEAKKQAKLPPTRQVKIVQTLSNAKRQSKKGKDNAWQLEWQMDGGSGATQTYKDLGLINNTIKIPARAGHGTRGARMANYSQTDKDERSYIHSVAPLEGGTEHSCSAKEHKELGPEVVLGSPEGGAAFAQWALATGLFNRRYGDADGEKQGALE